MPETTPGQVCYEAYSRVQRTGQPPRPLTPYVRLQDLTRAAWEAAAQAVMEGCAMLCPICGAELERCNAKDITDA